MITLIENGEVYGPESMGLADLLCVAEKIAKVGGLKYKDDLRIDVPVDRIDATDCYVFPGLIDPHEHLIGGSGEKSYLSRTPEIGVAELVEGGITTVVGCLGVDTVTLSPQLLLAKAKSINEAGLTAFIYTGGYDVPPVTLTGAIKTDLLFVKEIIGAGEIAIADWRSSQPTAQQIAQIVSECYVGGILSGVSGVTHFHVGDGKERLRILRDLIAEYSIPPAFLYPTHINRNEDLLREGIELTRQGITIDIDTVDEDLPRWMRFYLENGGDPKHLTISSDAGIPSPCTLFRQVAACFHELKIPLEQLMAMVTRNTSSVLQLRGKGRLCEGWDADVLVVTKDFEIRHVIAKGQVQMRDGNLLIEDIALSESNRSVTRHGKKSKTSRHHSPRIS